MLLFRFVSDRFLKVFIYKVKKVQQLLHLFYGFKIIWSYDKTNSCLYESCLNGNVQALFGGQKTVCD